MTSDQREAAPSKAEWERAFHHLCHLVALKGRGKLRTVIDRMVLVSFYIDPTSRQRSAEDVGAVLSEWFGIRLAHRDIQVSIDRQLRKGRLTHDGQDGALTLSPTTRLEHQQRIDAANALERDVRDEWLAQLRRNDILPRGVRTDDLWSCLRAYMARMFRQHGVSTIQLLVHKGGNETATGRATLLGSAIDEIGATNHRSAIERAVLLFFEDPGPSRTRYLTELLDGTFTFYALSISQHTATYLRDALPPLDLFLDTNVVLGLLGLQPDTAGATLELMDLARSGTIPILPRYHERTAREIRETLDAVEDGLRSNRWSPSDSRAVLARGKVNSIELRFHEVNAQRLTDPASFFEQFRNLDLVLQKVGLKLYRPHRNNFTPKEKWQLTAEFGDFARAARPDDSRGYRALDHDAEVWLSIQDRRKRTAAPLASGALFVTNDRLLFNFDREHLASKAATTTIFPNQLLQVLRPFVPTTDDFDRRFVGTFAAPEFRTMDGGYQEARRDVLFYLSLLKDVPEPTAVRLLAGGMLLEIPAGGHDAAQPIGAEIETAIRAENSRLIEQVAVAQQEVADLKARLERERNRSRAKPGTSRQDRVGLEPGLDRRPRPPAPTADGKNGEAPRTLAWWQMAVLLSMALLAGWSGIAANNPFFSPFAGVIAVLSTGTIIFSFAKAMGVLPEVRYLIRRKPDIDT